MNSPAAQLEVNVEASFKRYHGVHNFTTHNRNLNTGNGDNVTVVSQPDWDSFIGELGSLQSPTGIVFSPELITLEGDSSDLPRDSRELRSQQSKIERRNKTAEEFSGDNPDLIVVLGTAAFNADGNGGKFKPTNSSLFMRSGRTVAHTNQQYATGGKFDELFLLQQAQGGRTVRPDLASLVGRDLIGESLEKGEDKPPVPRAIGNFTETVLSSSGVSLSRENFAAASSAEEGLELWVKEFFRNRPHVRELMIADRVPDPNAVGAEGPLNAHFVRPEEA